VSPVTLGVDIGTTSVKAILLDTERRVVALAGNEHGIVRRPGVVEADPRLWWDSVCAATRQLAARAPGPMEQVAAVGLTGNMSSVVLLDSRLEPLGNAPLLADSRGEHQLAALPADLRELVFARTRNHPASAFSLSTLLYLRDEAPGLLDRTRVVISAKDYIRLCLTGTVGTDVTDAYNSLLIAADGADWDAELVEATGLPRRIFPAVYPSAQPAGAVSQQAAERTGIPAGVPVVTGAGDIAAGALGAGATEPGDVLISLGTSVTALAPVRRGSGSDWLGSLTYHPAASNASGTSGTSGLALASLLTGGLALNWLRELLGADAIAADAADPPTADDPLVFLPHLAGTGSPRFEPYVQGTLVGLRPSTRGADIVRALFEATGFEIAEALTLLGAARGGEILVSGGGTRLPAWPQTLSDILGRPVTICADPDVSAVGAACLAWEGLTGQAITKPPTAGKRYEPVTERAGPLRRRAGNYYQTRDFMTAYYQSRAGKSTL
jgi:xylulokinase